MVLIVGAGLGYVVRGARIQRDAVAAITAAGASVQYDWEWSLNRRPSAGVLSPQPWIVDLAGIDYWGSVTEVTFMLTDPVSDASLAHVGSLNRLQSLTIRASRESEAALAHLKGLTSLSVLRNSGSHVNDAALAHLEGLNGLSYVQLDENQKITDAGLVHPRGLPNSGRWDSPATK
jgi:hypothetical protein